MNTNHPSELDFPFFSRNNTQRDTVEDVARDYGETLDEMASAIACLRHLSIEERRPVQSAGRAAILDGFPLQTAKDLA